MIPNNEKKCNSTSYVRTPTTPSTSQQLRVRRGLGPMRCRLDSVGSVVSNSSTPTSPMTFDLLTPTPSSPGAFFCDDVYDVDDADDGFYYPVYDVATPTSPTLPPTLPCQDDHQDDVVDAQDAAAVQWRHVGRELRGIAHQFATTRRPPTTTTTHQVNSITYN